jgi:outer membrane protein OmpA-like peptidoglycan-associated protein
MKHTLISCFIVATLAACASAPQRNDQLELARAQVQSLSQDPLAAQAASRELQAARDELSQAEMAFEKRGAARIVTHHAYLAAREAEIGQARLAERRAQEEIAQGEAERTRVLLEARTREAEDSALRAQASQARASRQMEAAESAREDAAELEQQLADLRAQQTERGMVLTLSDVLFETDRSTLKRGTERSLDRLAEFLAKRPETRIIVEGHTDSRGSQTYNYDLSQRRASAVLDALVTRGVKSNQVEVVARGEQFPVANNETAAGRQQNRRVEIIFSDQSGQFSQAARR